MTCCQRSCRAYGCPDERKGTLDIWMVISIVGFIALLAIAFSFGCAPKCEKGQVMVKGKCYYPGVNYTTLLNGEEIRG